MMLACTLAGYAAPAEEAEEVVPVGLDTGIVVIWRVGPGLGGVVGLLWPVTNDTIVTSEAVAASAPPTVNVFFRFDRPPSVWSLTGLTRASSVCCTAN
jgi:hypothetical protein